MIVTVMTMRGVTMALVARALDLRIWDSLVVASGDAG